jgi:hypothetical protein
MTQQEKAKLLAVVNVAARRDGVHSVLPKASFA